MGCCLGRSSSSDSDDMENAITIGKNRPLIQEKIKWKSDVPMTEGQLRSKRDEFWETAPAFEGRKEIWDALRAASVLAEQGDYALSQAILDGANISLPDGTLRESYDELGNRYQVPYYCLSAPTNLIEERSSESSGGTALDGPHASDRIGSANIGELVSLKLRLSTTGEDLSIDCYSKETVHTVKQRLHQTVDNLPAANQQRWLYSGRILLDKMRIGDCRIPQNFVVQVVIHNNAKGNQDQHELKDLRQQAVGDNSPSLDTMVVISTTDPVEDNATRKNVQDAKVPGHVKAPVRPSSILSMSKDHDLALSPLPGSTLPVTSSGDGVDVSSDRGNRRSGSASSRKNQEKQRVRKLRSQQSNSGAVNGTSSAGQQRCNSFSSKRSAESPPPVETS